MTAEAVCLEKRSEDWKSIPLFGVSGVVSIVHENRGERIIFQPSRTDNRIRFLSLEGSSVRKMWVREVGKIDP